MSLARLLASSAIALCAACPGSVKAEMEGHFAPFGESKVHYRSIGAGAEALIFVHGWTCDSTCWRAQIDAFPGYRVIALDLPGHGRSEKPHVDYTITLFAQAIEAAMRDAAIEKAVLIGHSMGAPVVREFYRLFPERTTALVIVEGALRTMLSRDQAERLQAQLRADYAGGARRMVDGMLAPMRDETIRNQIRATMLATPDYVALSAMRSMSDEQSYGLDPIRVPLLAVLAKSPFWQPDTEGFLRSVAPDLEFHMMEDVSHFLMLDKPSEFNTLLREFLLKDKQSQLPEREKREKGAVLGKCSFLLVQKAV
ncbi:alpha/beta fold hydrolase [soil metagenome]